MALKKVTPQSAQEYSQETQPTASTPAPKAKKTPFPRKRLFIILGSALGLILLLGVVSVFAIYLPGRKVASSLKTTIASAQATVNSLQSQDLVAAEASLAQSRSDLEQTQNDFHSFSWLKVIPFVRSYYLDGEHGLNAASSGLDAAEVFIKAVEPYADILGLKANPDAAQETQSAEDRIIFLTQTLDAISPQLDDISAKLEDASKEINQINPNRYPKNIGNTPVRSRLIEVQDSIKTASSSLHEAKPLIALLPQLLGQEDEKLYMLLFQNNGEIRPTGGFMTAYAFIKVSKGKITPLESYDIYQLDARWGRTLPAPDPIKKYLPLVNNWNLRDMNLSPDFKVSMDTFYSNYRDIPGMPELDGIIALDTYLPVEMIKLLGPIGVGGWGTFTADPDPRCDCPQIIYVLEEIADKPTYTINTSRKAVLGPLMHSLLANAMGSPKRLWPQLLDLGIRSIKQKHLLLYFPEDNQEELAQAFGAAGRITDFEGDYLHINDSNFGGAKSDLFITRDVEQEINLDGNGKIQKTVTITYNNPHPASNCNLEAGELCLNGTYRDWVRLYVPLGATLDEVVGSEVEATTTEDLGKTVFEAFFTMRPQSSSKLVFRYTLPGTYSEPVPLLIQKQPGKDTIIHNILFNGAPNTIELNADTEVKLQS